MTATEKLTTLLGIARVEQKRGNLTQARQTIEQAIGMIESLRTNIAGQELRASYLCLHGRSSLNLTLTC